MTVKAKIWVKKSKRIKYLKVSDIEQIDGIWTAGKVQMITTKNKKKLHASVMKINSTQYNTDVSDEMFTTQRMERGL